METKLDQPRCSTRFISHPNGTVLCVLNQNRLLSSLMVKRKMETKIDTQRTEQSKRVKSSMEIDIELEIKKTS